MAACRQRPYPRLSSAVATARAEAAAGNRADTLRRLTSIFEEASRFGYAELALDAQLARTEVSGRPGTGTRLFHQLRSSSPRPRPPDFGFGGCLSGFALTDPAAPGARLSSAADAQ